MLHPHFADGSQQDSAEFFGCIAELLREGAVHVSDETAIRQSLTSFIVHPEGRRRVPFELTVSSQLQCQHCRHKRPANHQPAFFASVPIPEPASIQLQASRRRGDIIECLESYRSLETLSDVNCSLCSLTSYKRQLQSSATVATDIFSKFYIHDDRLFDALGAEDTVKREAVKIMSFSSLPEVLCVHLIRRLYDRVTGDMKKNNQTVRFSMELDMSPFWSFWHPEQPSRIKYQLMSVVQHIGNADAGESLSSFVNRVTFDRTLR